MIGLMTLHNANNYGAVLQSYALQSKISELGYESEYIDFCFKPKQTDNTYSTNTFKTKVKKLAHPLKILYGRKSSLNFKKFRENYINISQEKYFGDKDMHLCKKYDRYIVGSDQVWNFDITNSSKAYLLDFVDNGVPKNSYASSFGVDSIEEKQKRIFKEAFERFDNISVREKEGKKLVNDISSRDAQICLDPTLLLNRTEWKKIAVLPKVKDYILIYAMTDTDQIIDCAKKLAKKKKAKIIAIGLKKKYHNIKNMYAVSPEEWIGYFINASAVVTNSFHGSVFSLIFKKDFYIDYLPKTWKVNSRLKNLVDFYKLENRVLGCADIEHEDNINYDKIIKIIENERVKSLEYLKRICS